MRRRRGGGGELQLPFGSVRGSPARWIASRHCGSRHGGSQKNERTHGSQSVSSDNGGVATGWIAFVHGGVAARHGGSQTGVSQWGWIASRHGGSKIGSSSTGGVHKHTH